MSAELRFHKICEECGREFVTHMATTRTCSSRCANLAFKHRKRDERLKTTTIEVREKQRLALLDKDFLSLSDAARLLQISRNTLYKIIDRTVRIARADLDLAAEAKEQPISTETEVNMGKWMTRQQVMDQYNVTYSWFYSVLKKRGVKTTMIGTTGFYDKATMHKLFANQDYSHITEWYTFDEVRRSSGMKTESISMYLKDHKIPKMKKNNITYISKEHWDDARGLNIDRDLYYTIAEITEKYGLSRNHLFVVLKEHDIPRIKRGNFVYLPREEVDRVLAYRLEKMNGNE